MFQPLTIAKHVALFLVTFLTTTIAGMLWRNELDFLYIEKGLTYSACLLFILSAHEFGHFFAARAHRVSVTLPYYIPIPPIPEMINFGTLGAVIRTREPIPTRAALFDIGIAGPIAGFIASLLVLFWGFTHLPGPEYILAIHPDYDFGTGGIADPSSLGTLTFGSSVLYSMMQHLFAPAGSFVPPMTEMYHYPFLITGWFGLLVTALNLLPAGQLDGGHILYAMLGAAHRTVARITVILLLLFGGMGMLPGVLQFAGFPEHADALVMSVPTYGAVFWPGWLIWAILLLVVIKVDHPPVADSLPLDRTRMLLGTGACLMLILCLTPAPLYFQ